MFFLIDANNFYASCEEIFQPKLRNKPLVVLSNNDGCVIARSKQAKKLGIKMGEPAFLLKDKKEVIMLSSNFALYADLSQRIMQTIETFDYPLQIYSIDESFLECNEAMSSDELLQLGFSIKKKVKKWTGIDVSIGIAKTMTLAKLANREAKKIDGVSFLDDKHQIEEMLKKTPVEDIWGIGKRLSIRLKKKGIFSGKDLILQDEIFLQKLLGINGLKTALELKKIPSILLEEFGQKKQSIACCKSFYHKKASLCEIEKTLSSYAQIVTEKMRKQDLYAETLCVMLSTSPFEKPYYSNNITLSLPYKSNYTPDFISLAKWGLQKIFKPGVLYKKCGIILLDLQKSSSIQPSLLFSEKKQNRELMLAMDRINQKFDKQAIYFAAQEKWECKPYKNKSPRYTSSWSDLPAILS